MYSSLKKCSYISDVSDVIDTNFSRPLDLKDRALFDYAKSWCRHFSPSDAFNIECFIAKDLSGILFGGVPVIYFGSNEWVLKHYLPTTDLRQRLDMWHRHLSTAVSSIGKPIFIVVVPEKDDLVRSAEYFENTSNLECVSSVQEFLSNVDSRIVGCTFLDGLIDPNLFSSLQYAYYDSHLLSQDYLIIFRNILAGFGFNETAMSVSVEMLASVLYGDFDDKMVNSGRLESFLFPEFTSSVVRQIGGSPTYCNPLRETWQSFECSDAPLSAKVVIFGDSHSSVYHQKRLTYMLANTFRLCEFYWNPFCMNRDFEKAASADYVVLEMSERFLFSGS